MFLHQNRNVLLQHQQIVLKLLDQLGFILNVEKSKLAPSQDIQFLGMRLLLLHGMACLPQDCVEQTQILIRSYMTITSLTYSESLSLLGHLNWSSSIIYLGRLRLRPIQQFLKRKGLLSQSSPRREIETKEFQQTLQVWLDPSFLNKGITFQPFPTQETMYSDASNQGWGAHLGSHSCRGLWSQAQQELHIP